MSKAFELLMSGVSLGFLYSLLALGFVVLFRARQIVNFAHGSLLLIGAYVVATAHPRLGFGLALALGAAASAAAGLLIDLALIRRLRAPSPMTLALLTIGVDMLLVTELTRRIGSDVLSLGDPWGDRVMKIAGYTLPEARIAAVIAAAGLLALFFIAFRYTNWGVSMRAAAADPLAATLMGIRLGRVSAAAWVVAGVLAAVAGVFLAAFPNPGLTAAAATTALLAFPAAIMGGLDSPGGAVVGGILVGVTEAMAAGYQDSLLFLGRGFGQVAPFVVMILVLLWRPTGLFGVREISRV